MFKNNRSGYNICVIQLQLISNRYYIVTIPNINVKVVSKSLYQKSEISQQIVGNRKNKYSSKFISFLLRGASKLEL